MANSNQTQYSDSQLEQLEQERATAQQEVDTAYDQRLQQVDDIYQKQGQAVEDYQNAQAAQQQEQTDFLIDQIGQQQEQARKDYTKEQSAAYTDYQKQVDPHGVNAEAMAAAGMDGTGYSESSRVDMYNTYQNRVATARAVYDQAVRNYENAIQEAWQYNSSALAEIAYNALQTQLSLDLEGIQYQWKLEQARADEKLQLDRFYDGRIGAVQDQINAERALANTNQLKSQTQYIRELEELIKQLQEQAAPETPNDSPLFTDTGGSLGKVHYFGKINGEQRDLTEEEYRQWENRFEEASTGGAMEALVLEMLDGGINKNTAQELYEKFKWKFEVGSGKDTAAG